MTTVKNKLHDARFRAELLKALQGAENHLGGCWKSIIYREPARALENCRLVITKMQAAMLLLEQADKENGGSG